MPRTSGPPWGKASSTPKTQREPPSIDRLPVPISPRCLVDVCEGSRHVRCEHDVPIRKHGAQIREQTYAERVRVGLGKVRHKRHSVTARAVWPVTPGELGNGKECLPHVRRGAPPRRRKRNGLGACNCFRARCERRPPVRSHRHERTGRNPGLGAGRFLASASRRECGSVGASDGQRRGLASAVASNAQRDLRQMQSPSLWSACGVPCADDPPAADVCDLGEGDVRGGG